MIILAGKPHCPNCNKAKQKLEQLDVPYIYVDLSVDADLLTRVRQDGLRSVPQMYRDVGAKSYQDIEYIGDFQFLMNSDGNNL